MIYLDKLNCSGCIKLTTIPSTMQNLTRLECYNCTSLTFLHTFKKLESLSCSGCVKLTSLPLFRRLLRLNCNYCTNLTHVPFMEYLYLIYCDGCKWLNQNKDYNNNITKLKIIQKYYKK